MEDMHAVLVTAKTAYRISSRTTNGQRPRSFYVFLLFTAAIVHPGLLGLIVMDAEVQRRSSTVETT